MNAGIKSIEKIAKKLMDIDFKICDKYCRQDGDRVEDKIYVKELKKELAKAKINSLHSIYEHILEDANFHTLNKHLSELHIFKNSYEDSEETYNEYKSEGGRTWRL